MKFWIYFDHKNIWIGKKESDSYQRKPFIEQIEWVLKEAGKPSFREKYPETAIKLQYLEDAKNIDHETDCYYVQKLSCLCKKVERSSL